MGASGRDVLAVGSAGLGLFDASDGWVEPWSNVSRLRFHSGFQVDGRTVDGRAFEFVTGSTQHHHDIASAIPASERSRLGNGWLHQERLIDPLRAPESSSRRYVWNLLWAGLILEFIGAAMLAVSWPATRFDVSSGSSSTDGNSLVTWLGLLVVAVGSTATLVAIIALGVWLGLAAAREAEPTTQTA